METVKTTEHGLDECVRRVQGSPVAMKKILAHLTQLVTEDQMRDPKWASTLDSAVVLARATGAPGWCPRPLGRPGTPAIELPPRWTSMR